YLSFFFFFSSRRRHTRSKRDWSQTCALPIYIRVCLCCSLILHPDINQHLGIDPQILGKLAHLLFPCQHYFHHLQAGKDAVSCRGVLGKDNMPRLLSAQTTAVLRHIFVYILVSNGGLCVVDARLVKSFVQPKI